MLDDLGNDEVRRLSDAGVVERPDNADRQPVAIDPGDQFHRDFADAVIVGRFGACFFVKRTFTLVAIDVRAAGQQDHLRPGGSSDKRLKQVARADHVGAVQLVHIVVGDKCDGGQMHDVRWLHIGNHLRKSGQVRNRSDMQRCDAFYCVGAGCMDNAMHFITFGSQPWRKVSSGETVHPRHENAVHGSQASIVGAKGK